MYRVSSVCTAEFLVVEGGGPPKLVFSHSMLNILPSSIIGPTFRKEETQDLAFASPRHFSQSPPTTVHYVGQKVVGGPSTIIRATKPIDTLHRWTIRNKENVRSIHCIHFIIEIGS